MIGFVGDASSNVALCWPIGWIFRHGQYGFVGWVCLDVAFDTGGMG